MVALPPVVEKQLGPERAARVLLVRRRLLDAGLVLPAWIDARPGRLKVLIGDLSAGPPLCRSAQVLALSHGARLLQGLGALSLATAAPRTAVVAHSDRVVRELSLLARGTQVEVVRGPPVWPSQPELQVHGAPGHCWVVSAQTLDRAAGALLAQPPLHLCTVAGAVSRPQVVSLLPDQPQTPAELLRLCGGATTAAWVAVAGGAPDGQPWDADLPLPLDVTLLLVLPAGHELVRQLRRHPAEWLRRAVSACPGCGLCTDACPQHLRGHPLSPAALVLLLAEGRTTEPATLLPALFCTGCGVCDVVCPAGLSPRSLVRSLRERLLQGGIVAPEDDGPRALAPGAALRQIPLSLLTAQLGLSEYLGARDRA